ncbi:ATP/GTP-binding protein [Moraxella sp. ZY210820]|uniref:AAA family ATPase n=1 Tax=unclassified Moraxella TaxID=2685852 RepID=UPI00273141CA|nr:ATP-binding protein [Moraxella sp. ZY210820]WLF82928.1 AAA family ATPase [Moraxella sp. ZY210820]
MLKSLQIQNFRGLKDVKIPTLGRVNLIVGENNAGKSSVLEALRIYASGGNPYVLDNIARSHHEETLSEQYNDIKNNNYDRELSPFSDFFYQRKYPKDNNENIMIGEINQSFFEMTYNHKTTAIDVKNPFNLGLFEISHSIPSKLEYKEKYRTLKKGKHIYLSKYIPTQFVDIQELSAYWDKIILTPYENEVIKSLQIIEPDIEKLAFINQLFNDNRIPMVGLKNSEKPIPLYSMGDGMKRILQLILNLHQAKDGLLLIDEFDNGLHYKVQEKVWGLLFELAERFNVQVFATTHSNDCIRAFSKISQVKTDIDGMLIQMTKEHYKDGTSQIVANVVDENQLQRLLNLGVDVR